MASQARHKLGAPNESISSRSVVLDRGGEGMPNSVLRKFGRGGQLKMELQTSKDASKIKIKEQEQE
jgi:hypothetical protein